MRVKVSPHLFDPFTVYTAQPVLPAAVVAAAGATIHDDVAVVDRLTVDDFLAGMPSRKGLVHAREMMQKYAARFGGVLEGDVWVLPA